MRNRGNQRGSDDSSEDERIIKMPIKEAHNEDAEQEEGDWLENSQELTQIVPRKSDKKKKRKKEKKNRESDEYDDPLLTQIIPKKSDLLEDEAEESDTGMKKKRKKDKKNRSLERSNGYEETQELERNHQSHKKSPSFDSFVKPSAPPSYKAVNGYRVRELDTSEFPAKIIADMMRVAPTHSKDEMLTVDAVEDAASSPKGGVWILKCPKDVQLKDVLLGRKLSLSGTETEFDSEDDDTPQLTQYIPTNSLGVNIKNRRFQATSLPNDEYKDGALLLLPEGNKFKLAAAPIEGHIVIRESVKHLELPEISVPKAPPRHLPTGIKERHPVYGANFSKIITEMETQKRSKRKSKQYDNSFANDDAVPVKMEIESDEATQTNKRKKKKKDKKNEDEVDSGFGNEYDQTRNYSEKKSKKRKRDEMDDPCQDLNCTVLMDEIEPPSKKKKSKHRTYE